MIMSALGARAGGQGVHDGDLGALEPGIDLRQWMLSEAAIISAGPGDDDLDDLVKAGNPAGGVWVMHPNTIYA